MGHYSAFKKEGNSAIYACMDEPGGHYAQWISQAEKDKYCMVSLIGGISKKKKKSVIHKKSTIVMARGCD